ncbi:MAG: glycosyltransferase family 4 protein [Clostridia bacterium]
MYSINMLSSADKVKGQGVGSAYLEQVDLVKKGLGKEYEVFINKFKFADIMHYHTIDFKHFILAKFARFKSVNVGYVHFTPETVDDSISLPRPIKFIFYKYVIAFYKSMDVLVTVNPYFIDILEKYKIKREKVTYIPNFVSEDNFYRVDSSERSKLREKHNISKDDFVVIGVGQVQTRKGVLDFVNIASKLKDYKFKWIGGFSFGKITAGYKELKKSMEDPENKVEFLGILEREKMNEIYNIADLLFLPSFQELFPMTILEAFNCKLPILLRDLDIYPGVFSGYYLKGSNTDEFIDVIKNLRNDKQFYEDAKLKSWEGHNFYCKEHVLSMWKDFYGKIVTEK